jgi:methionine-S-sulfoxide reductase
VRTTAGYCGGAKRAPTYHDLGDHTESLRVEYDASVVSYDRLLEVFWEEHDPTAKAWSRQYASFVFAQDEAQERRALASRAEQVERVGPIATEIVRGATFWPAEGYHQKYYLRGVADVRKAFEAAAPRDADLVASTLAARVNGYVGGWGTLDEVRRTLDAASWPEDARKRLLDALARRRPPVRCG